MSYRYPPFFPFRLKRYQSQTYAVRLFYPSHWRRIPNYDERYGAADGFFQVSAISSGGANINELAYQEAFHHLQPYGSNPMIFRGYVAGQEARFIFPSADQPPEMSGQAAIIIRYPRPITISGEIYDYLILWVDRYHLFWIAQTIRFQ